MGLPSLNHETPLLNHEIPVLNHETPVLNHETPLARVTNATLVFKDQHVFQNEARRKLMFDLLKEISVCSIKY